MKILFLARHAAAGWADARTADHDRPLSATGLDEARAIGEALRRGGTVPGRILTSTAVRARRTAAIVAENLDPRPEEVAVHDLYLADPEFCLEQIRELPDELDAVLLVGHNPGLEALSRSLTGEALGFGTGTLARIDLRCDAWRDVDRRSGEATRIWRPGT